jgi:hypothetical protein
MPKTRATAAVCAALSLSLAAVPAADARKHRPKGPSAKTVKKQIAPILKEVWAPIFGGPEDVHISWHGKVRVLKARKVDPYAGVPNHAGGKIWMWPARVKVEAKIYGADGKPYKDCKFGSWRNESYDFYHPEKGKWAWKGSKIDSHKPGNDSPCTDL